MSPEHQQPLIAGLYVIVSLSNNLYAESAQNHNFGLRNVEKHRNIWVKPAMNLELRVRGTKRVVFGVCIVHPHTSYASSLNRKYISPHYLSATSTSTTVGTRESQNIMRAHSTFQTRNWRWNDIREQTDLHTSTRHLLSDQPVNITPVIFMRVHQCAWIFVVAATMENSRHTTLITMKKWRTNTMSTTRVHTKPWIRHGSNSSTGDDLKLAGKYIPLFIVIWFKWHIALMNDEWVCIKILDQQTRCRLCHIIPFRIPSLHDLRPSALELRLDLLLLRLSPPPWRAARFRSVNVSSLRSTNDRMLLTC